LFCFVLHVLLIDETDLFKSVVGVGLLGFVGGRAGRFAGIARVLGHGAVCTSVSAIQRQIALE